MSSLGIRYVLPYKGANGIKVVDNIISIDPNSGFITNGITIGLINISNNEIIIGDGFGYFILKINQNIIGFYQPPGEVENVIIHQDGTITTIGNINGNFITASKLQTIGNNLAAPQFTIDSIQPGIVTPTQNITISLDGGITEINTA